jgi:hypothetical protein
MLALGEKCIHPTSQKPYIKSFTGGKNNSPEGHAVHKSRNLPPGLLLMLVKDPHTHGFVVEFENAEDRDYYVFKDPAHQEFIKFAGEVANGVKVVDYEPGKV